MLPSSGALGTGKGANAPPFPRHSPYPLPGQLFLDQLPEWSTVFNLCPQQMRLLGELWSWHCRLRALSTHGESVQEILAVIHCSCQTGEMYRMNDEILPFDLIPLGPRSSSVTRNCKAEYSCCSLTGPHSPTLWLTGSSHTSPSPITRFTSGLCPLLQERALIPFLSP